MTYATIAAALVALALALPVNGQDASK